MLSRLTAIGRLLTALRIAGGLAQRELAQRLGVDESQVSRDERNEYFGNIQGIGVSNACRGQGRLISRGQIPSQCKE